MQLLSALSSTTSPLAMQAMPLVAPGAGDFAALIAGMVPAGDATTVAVPVERQAIAPTGNPLPVTLAAPVALDGVAPIAPPETVVPLTPPLPVSATEAVLMLPQEAAAPVVTPIRQVAPMLVAAAAIDGLADVLPDKETVETPPRAEDVAARALPLPVPTRFAMTPPRAKRAENAAPDTPSPLREEDGTDPEAPTADAGAPVVAAPLVVPQPADAIILPAIVQAGDPAVASGDGATPAAALVIEGGEIVAAEPVSAKAPPMRMAKRADAPLPPARRAAATPVDRTPDVDDAATVAEPAVGVVTPLNTDQVVPVHVVVPPVADGAPVRGAGSPVLRPATVTASAVAPPLMPAPPMPGSASVASSSARSTGPAAAPTAGIAQVADGAPVVAAPVDAPVRGAGSPVLRPATVAASAVAPPLMPAPPVPGSAPVASFSARSTGPAAAPTAGIAPVASVAPGGLAGAMIDLLPVGDAPLPPAAASATPEMMNVAPTMPTDAAAARVAIDVGQPARTAATDAVAVSPTILSRPTTRAGVAPTAPASRGAAPTAAATVARDIVTPAPVARPAARPTVPATTAETIVERPSIASEAAAPVVPVAAPPAQPSVLAPPVTRIAGDPAAAALAPDAPAVAAQGVPPTVRHAVDAPASAPAAMPPVTRIAAVPMTDVAPAVVDAVLRDGDPQAPRARRDDDPAIPTTGAITAPDAAVLRPVAPAAHAAGPALDTRQPQWVEGMIDRITTLREASGTNNGETRIRLSPDALGDVEVAIRTGDDGKLHVHFNSDNADAGRLLAEAQPRLVQMAEARGLKLGGMQVDVGSQQSQQSGQSQRQAQDQGNPAPRAPRTATTRTTTQTNRSDDRIA